MDDDSSQPTSFAFAMELAIARIEGKPPKEIEELSKQLDAKQQAEDAAWSLARAQEDGSSPRKIVWLKAALIAALQPNDEALIREAQRAERAYATERRLDTAQQYNEPPAKIEWLEAELAALEHPTDKTLPAKALEAAKLAGEISSFHNAQKSSASPPEGPDAPTATRPWKQPLGPRGAPGRAAGTPHAPKRGQ